MSLKTRLKRMGQAPGLLQRRSGLGQRGEQGSLAGAAALLDAALGPASQDLPSRAPCSAPGGMSSGGAREAFAPFETPEGIILRRSVRWELSARGENHLHLLGGAQPGILALLALDHRLATCDPLHAVFFDTETTGLGGAGSLAFLVGMGWAEGSSFVLEQLLLESPAQEPALLARIRECFTRAQMVVSFNGKSFDLPLLSGRCVMNRGAALPARPHLDLLHLARRIHKRRLQTFRLSILEQEVLGVQRPKDDIPGAEIPPRFGHFLRTGEFEAIAPVVLHNEWDVLSMVALVGVYGSPLSHLSGGDLLGVAETYRRSGKVGGALDVVGRVLETSPSRDALLLRARLQKAQGDRKRALLDFERLHAEKKSPEITLELVKLYEHFRKDFESALSCLEHDTGETPDDIARRRERLMRKRARGAPRGD